MVGIGEVGANGLKARGEAATGLPEYVMIKVRSFRSTRSPRVQATAHKSLSGRHDPTWHRRLGSG